jgi:hypothetical protein
VGGVPLRDRDDFSQGKKVPKKTSSGSNFDFLK